MSSEEKEIRVRRLKIKAKELVIEPETITIRRTPEELTIETEEEE